MHSNKFHTTLVGHQIRQRETGIDPDIYQDGYNHCEQSINREFARKEEVLHDSATFKHPLCLLGIHKKEYTMRGYRPEKHDGCRVDAYSFDGVICTRPGCRKSWIIHHTYKTSPGLYLF